jgi:CheY-like chemotaxis protein
MRILLADDNEYNRIVARDTLELKIDNVHIQEATDGADAVAKFRTGEFDIVLMDVQMPVLDGYDATRAIRSEFTAPKNQVPVIALTASVIRTDLEKCLQAGMNGYIPKPFRVDELLCTIHSLRHGEKMDLPQLAPADTPREQPERVTDLVFLREFTEGDETQMRKYVTMYLESASKTLVLLEQALETKDYAAVKRTVHQLKPHLRFMGMHSVSAVAETIEHVAATGNIPANFHTLVQELSTTCRRSFSELREFSQATEGP